jgi:hypothetical protein
MSFQVVECEIDEQGEVVERKVVPYPYQSRQEAMVAIEQIAAKYSEASFDEIHNLWHALGGGGERLRLAIEEIRSRAGE